MTEWIRYVCTYIVGKFTHAWNYKYKMIDKHSSCHEQDKIYPRIDRYIKKSENVNATQEKQLHLLNHYLLHRLCVVTEIS